MIHRGALPPMNPVADMRWRSAGKVYVWTPGRGWVAEAVPAVAVPAKPKGPAQLICEGCGGPRSYWSARFCRSCYRSGQSPKRINALEIRRLVAENESLRGQVAALTARLEALAGPSRPETPPAPEPVEPAQAERIAQSEAMMDKGAMAYIPTGREIDARDGKTIEDCRARFVVALPSAIPRFPVVKPPAQKPREVKPEPEGPKVSAPHEREAPHPILERHARQAPVDPLARVRERKPASPPAFSPEFEAQMARVRAGAGIVEIRPISRPVDEAVGGASSLNFI